MIREYVGAQDYLDDVAVQVERLIRRHHRARAGTNDPADLRALAELDLEADRADEVICARCEASHALGIELPLDRLRWRLEVLLAVHAQRARHVIEAVERGLVELAGERGRDCHRLLRPDLDTATTELVKEVNEHAGTR